MKGRFHGFDLAGELERRGYLHQLVTSYPKFFAARWQIPRARVSSVLSTELLQRAEERLPTWLRERYDAESALLDHYESVHVPIDDIGMTEALHAVVFHLAMAQLRAKLARLERFSR